MSIRNISLYDNFKHLKDYDNVWVISDTHFNDNDNELFGWPTDEERLKLINSKISKKDAVIHLGDVGDVEFIKRIKGTYKILITGNHDRSGSYYKREERVRTCVDTDGHDISDEIKNQPNFTHFDNLLDNKVALFDNHLFDEVYEGPVFISPKILLSHEPVKLDFGLNIHGHCHSSPKFEYWHIDRKGHVNLAADVVDFEPKRLDKIIGEFKVTDLHRVTINKADRDAKMKEDKNNND